MNQLTRVEPLGYADSIRLQEGARLVLVDSGGIQEETTVLGIPCLTLRENTERPVTVTEGTNKVVGCEPERIVSEAFRILDGEQREGRVPDLWDGQAASRIVEVLQRGVRRR
jgi:UDP-N-acetylglucosamine 2-epimerase (non-hydrolysing)